MRSSLSASESSHSAFRHAVLVLGAAAALFTAISTSVESQRRVARNPPAATDPSDSAPSAAVAAATTCPER